MRDSYSLLLRNMHFRVEGTSPTVGGEMQSFRRKFSTRKSFKKSLFIASKLQFQCLRKPQMFGCVSQKPCLSLYLYIQAVTGTRDGRSFPADHGNLVNYAPPLPMRKLVNHGGHPHHHHHRGRVADNKRTSFDLDLVALHRRHRRSRKKDEPYDERSALHSLGDINI